MRLHRYVATISTAGGSGSVNTIPFIGGLCRQVYVLARTSGTSFRVNLTDPDSLTVRDYGAVITTLNDDNRPLPVQGIYTVNVTNTSADGNFAVLMMIEE